MSEDDKTLFKISIFVFVYLKLSQQFERIRREKNEKLETPVQYCIEILYCTV